MSNRKGRGQRTAKAVRIIEDIEFLRRVLGETTQPRNRAFITKRINEQRLALAALKEESYLWRW